MKIAVCVVGKEENKYIKEYIEYYKNIGIDKIFLYDNNEIDGECFEGYLNQYIKNNFIELINFRGLFKPQKRAYYDCYNNNKNYFDWIAFFDLDEYLYVENYTNLKDFLSLSKFNNCSSILFNWRYYGDNNEIFYHPKPLQQRFKIPVNKSFNNTHYFSAAKSIVKGKLIYLKLY